MTRLRHGWWLSLLHLMLLTSASGADMKMEPQVFESASGGKLPYLIHLPKGSTADERLPLLVFLHGAGERGQDGQRQMKHRQVLDLLTAKGSPQTIFIAPQCPPDEKWSNVNWNSGRPEPQEAEPTKPMRLLFELLDSLDRDLPIDPSRRYLTGLSMGGFGTFDALMRRPDYFAAGVVVCGGADDTKAKAIAHVPVWVFHGGADDVVKPSRSRSIVAALQAAGGHPRFTEYPGVGHAAWSKAYAEPGLAAWLFEQRRPAASQ